MSDSRIDVGCGEVGGGDLGNGGDVGGKVIGGNVNGVVLLVMDWGSVTVWTGEG